MAQIMESKGRQAIFFKQLFQLVISGAGVHRCFGFERIGKDPDRVGTFFATSQSLCGAVGQEDLSGSGVSLGVARHQPPTLFLVDGSVDTQRSLPGIEVRPHESADLTKPQAGGQLCVEEVLPDGGLLYCRQKGIQLFFVENGHRLMSYFGRLHMVSGIIRQQPLVYCGLQRMVQGGVDAVDGGGGQPTTLTGAGDGPGPAF